MTPEAHRDKISERLARARRFNARVAGKRSSETGSQINPAQSVAQPPAQLPPTLQRQLTVEMTELNREIDACRQSIHQIEGHLERRRSISMKTLPTSPMATLDTMLEQAKEAKLRASPTQTARAAWGEERFDSMASVQEERQASIGAALRAQRRPQVGAYAGALQGAQAARLALAQKAAVAKETITKERLPPSALDIHSTAGSQHAEALHALRQAQERPAGRRRSSATARGIAPAIPPKSKRASAGVSALGPTAKELAMMRLFGERAAAGGQ